MAWRITGYETGPGQNDLAVLLTHRDLYCLGCNSSGLRVINPSSLPVDNGGEAQKVESRQGSVWPQWIIQETIPIPEGCFRCV